MKTLLTISLLLLCCLFARVQSWADCHQGKILYQKALTENDPARIIDLLQQSLAECKDFNAYYELARAYINQGRLDDAEQALRDAYNVAGNSKARARALALLGQVFEAGGKEYETVVCLRLAYENYPHPKIREKLKDVEIKLASKGMTAESIKKALTSNVCKSFGVEPSLDLRIHFDFDSSKLNAAGTAQTDELGKALTDPAFGGKSFLLIGHTDSRSTDAYNQDLSERRAETVKAYLVGNFELEATRIRTEGHGEQELLYPGKNEEEHALNRRVEVILR